mmetsp:Transcript_25861/g.60236  ORF Transcript_25861/g.60236 Transcript_25861/m.60236 type:complete len:258 (+) Transcript_25861:58-831(+)
MSTSKAEKNLEPDEPEAAQCWLSFDETFGGDAYGIGEKFKEDDADVQEDDHYDRWVDKGTAEQRQWDQDADDNNLGGATGAGSTRAAADDDGVADGAAGPEWDADHNDNDADAGDEPPVKRRKGRGRGRKGLGAKGRGAGTKGGLTGPKAVAKQKQAPTGGDRQVAVVCSSSSSSSSSSSDVDAGTAAPSGHSDPPSGSLPGELPTSVDGWVAAQKRLFGHMDPLPAGWIRMVSKSRNVIYFYNVRTGESSGEVPTR